MSRIKQYIPVLTALVKTDLQVLLQVMKDRFIDLLIWVTTTILVAAYLLPAFGMNASFGPFLAAGTVTSAALFQVFPAVMQLISDFEGPQTITFYATLPMPTSWVFLRLFISYNINAFILCIIVLPLAKLMLWNMLDLSHANIIKLILMYPLMTMFTGSFTLWVASFVPNVQKIGSAWMRMVYPLWFLGGYQFSWKVVYAVVPLLSYLLLLNPMIYLMEGYRNALLGADNYLPFGLCVVMTILFTIFFMWHAIRRLKRRLDFI